MSEKIAYEKHPVSSERKRELRQQGYKILDIRFKPIEEVKASGRGKSKEAEQETKE